MITNISNGWKSVTIQLWSNLSYRFVNKCNFLCNHYVKVCCTSQFVFADNVALVWISESSPVRI